MEARKGPVEVLVIDHIERAPTEKLAKDFAHRILANLEIRDRRPQGTTLASSQRHRRLVGHPGYCRQAVEWASPSQERHPTNAGVIWKYRKPTPPATWPATLFPSTASSAQNLSASDLVIFRSLPPR